MRHSVLLTLPLQGQLPRLHTLRLTFYGEVFSQLNLQCLFSHAAALRQPELGCENSRWNQKSHFPLDRQAGLQLDLLTVDTSTTDEQTVQLLACILCPLAKH